MRCAKCGADNREGRKFCAKCAAPVARVCPQCGASNEPGENFCGECAAPLGQAPTASPKKSNDSPIRVAEMPAPENLEGERKTVTALFADIKGSTELDGGPRSRGGARDHRPGAEADDRSGAALRRLRRAIDRRRHLRAIRRARRARGPSAARAVCRAAHAGGPEALLGKIARDRQPTARSARRGEYRRGGRAVDSNRRRTD